MTQAAQASSGSGRPHWPAVSVAQAHAMLTAPGAMFEMESLEQDGGAPVRAWKNGPKSLVEVFAAARTFGAREFIVHEAERITYDAFVRATLAFAETLRARGVGKGDRVAIIMRNLPEWPVAFFGAALLGAIATPLNAWWTAPELAYALNDSGAVAAVFDAERYKRAAARLAGCPALRHIFVSRLQGDAQAGVDRLESLIGGPGSWASLPQAIELPANVTPEDDATLVYTSGTTGSPKGAVATHRAATTAVFATLLSQARAFVRRGEAPPTPDPAAPQKSFILAIPLFHVTGAFAVLNIAIILGAKLVLMRKWEPETAMMLVERERATSIGGVPTIAWQLLEHPARAKYDLSSLDAVTYGGAPAAPELVRQLSLNFPAAQAGSGWGMTETCATFTHHIGEDYVQHPDSCGPAAPVGDIMIAGPRGEALPAGQTGELWVRGPNVVRGYWNNPEATAQAFHDGWLKTGDLARLDDEGFCYIVDRIKDVIIRGGENIYSVEVEDVLYDHPAIMDAALVPIPHPVLGEEPGAVVTLKPGAEATEDELRAHVAARLAPFKTPVRVLVMDDPLPRNANGKILKPELRKLFAADKPALRAS